MPVAARRCSGCRIAPPLPAQVAGQRAELAGESEERGRLACAVCPEQREDLAATHDEVEVAHRGLAAVPGREPAARRGALRRLSADARGTDARSRGDAFVAEVGVDHGAVARDDLRITLRDELAEVEHGDAIAHAEHERHVVLDEQHRHAPLVGEAADEAAELGGLLVAEARGRFVEQQHRGLRGHRAGERHEASLAERELFGPTIEIVLEVELSDHGRRRGAERKPARMHEIRQVGAPVAGIARRCGGFRGRSCRRTARGSGTSDPLRPRRACARTMR